MTTPNEGLTDSEPESAVGTIGIDLDDDDVEDLNVKESFRQDVHSVPTVAEVTGGKTDRDGTGPNGPTVIFCLICFLIVSVVSIGLGIGLTREEIAEEEEWKKEQEKAIDLTEYDEDTRFRDIVNYLGNYSVSDWSDLLSTKSAQNKAVNWMAHTDELQLMVPTEPIGQESGYEFVTRYALAVIFYSMGGEGWSDQLNFLSKNSVCNWFEIIVAQFGMFPRGVACNDNDMVDALFLDSNNLVGTIPKELGFITTLRALNMDINTIKGDLPSSLRRLSAVQHVTIAHNTLSGEVPSWIHRLVSLETLDLSYNFMQGGLPKQLTQMESLSALALDNNVMDGEIGHVFGAEGGDGIEGGLTNIEFLYLEDNNFTGTIKDGFLTGMTQLRRLDLSGNKFEGYLPLHFFTMPLLEVLDLHNNKLHGNLPTFRENTALKFLALQKNEIYGRIPPEIGNLQGLFHLDLSNNLFVEEIPDEMGNLNNLTYLFLAKNSFEPGPFPVSFGRLGNLKDLSLKATQRTGPLPEFVGNLDKMVLLDLDDNKFSGTIPTTIGKMKDLQFLLLNGNKFNQSVPEELGGLYSLRLFFMDGNDLKGTLDNIFCNRPENVYMPYIVADCGIPTVEVACSCCFKCCTDEAPCNDDDLVPSNDPMWQFGYQRLFYVFGDRTAFFAFP